MDKSDLSIDVKEDHVGTKTARVWANHLDEKVTSLERIFLITNFILEIPSAVFDQLSSVHRPQYALLNMLMSFVVMVISITDLVYKGQRARIKWMKKGLIPWFYHPHPISEPFGTFVDIIGLLCAIFQCIFASIAYVSLSRRADYPIKFSTWPIIFAFGLLYSKLSASALQRSSTSHVYKVNRPEEFTLSELAAATNHFSDDNRAGKGRYGIVYKGQLLDGRQVAIIRRDIGQGDTFKEKDRAFESEFAYTLRLHHRNLVSLVGYCEEGTERLLVYDFFKNGSLCNHLFLTGSSVIDTWLMRIRIALDAAKGIDYLHNYAVPPIIHRAIKSSCILLNDNWTAGVADLGSAMKRLESEPDDKSKMAAEEVDVCLDPEYFALNIFTTRSDVFSFGVVLLELLTGKRAIFNDGGNGGKRTKLVDFAVPKILRNELVQVLDPRVGPPKSDSETEAVEMVAYTALQCVNSEGNNRPTMTSIVINLEQALSLLNDTMRVIVPGQVQNSLTSGSDDMKQD